jgi:hypothetical protein
VADSCALVGSRSVGYCCDINRSQPARLRWRIKKPEAGNDGSAGGAYVFGEVHGGWVKQATLTAASGDGCLTTCSSSPGYVGGDSFGTAVATSGRTIVVGAPYESVPPAPDGVGTGTA